MILGMLYCSSETKSFYCCKSWLSVSLPWRCSPLSFPFH